jgi:hypothetical protein
VNGAVITALNEADTIGGLVLHELGRMPRRGEAITIGGLELKVQRADRRRIETPEPNPGMLPMYSQELGEEFAEKPQGKPREWWLDLPCGAVIAIDDTNDCGEPVDLVRVREVSPDHDAWVKG